MPDRRRSAHRLGRRRARAAAAALVLALAGVTPATPVHAQERPDSAAAPDSAPPLQRRAAVFGTVRAPNGDPIEEAEVLVVGSDARRSDAPGGGRAARSGPGGAFRLDGMAPGRYFLRARRLGFEPLYFSATLRRDEARRVDLELTRLPAQLAEVTVRARAAATAGARTNACAASPNGSAPAGGGSSPATT